jgi:delta 1-pyrroline-5-carboxylate dehydrogenase
MTITRLLPQWCLNCSRRISAAEDLVASEMPPPGSYMVCLYCSHIMKYDESYRLREMTVDEANKAAVDHEMQETVDFCRLYQALHKDKLPAPEDPQNG